MDKTRQQLKRENKNRAKSLRKREEKRSYKIFIFSMIVGALNYIFWNDQFLKLDTKYAIIFIALPAILGLFIFYRMNKLFIKSILDTKSGGIIDTILSYGVLIIGSLFFAYYAIVTLASVVFKLGMDYSVKDKPIVNKTYVVESTYRNDRGRGMHFFSHIRYFDETNDIDIFDVGVDDVTTSNQKRKIIFQCKEGFWGYYKIVDYKIIDDKIE